MGKLIIGFSKPKKYKPFAWLIMKGYQIPYSHVYVKFWSEKYGRFLIYQASHTMVNFMGTDVFEDQAEVIKEFDLEVSDETRTQIMKFAIDNAGKPYGMLNAVGLAWVRICELFGKNVKNPFSDEDKTYVCCEIVAHILKEYLDVEIHQDLNNINPKEIYEILTELAGQVSSAPDS